MRQRYQVRVQAQCQWSVLKLVRIMPKVTAVQTHADGSFEIRSDHTGSTRSGDLLVELTMAEVEHGLGDAAKVGVFAVERPDTRYKQADGVAPLSPTPLRRSPR